jgi:regulator of RNase E activity RraA
MDKIGVDGGGALDGLRILGRRLRAAGPVETVSADVARSRRYPIDDFSIGEQIARTPAGSILVIDLMGEPVSSWGAMATRAAIAGGLEACAIHGGARDADDLEDLDFLVAARHVTPRTGKGRIRFTGRGAAVQWGDARIQPGDWLVVDRTGAVVIPAQAALEVAREALELEALDAQFRQLLEHGHSFEDARRRLGQF